MDRKSDPTEYSPGSAGSKGRPKHSTEMVKGKGKFSRAQLADNSTQPYSTGPAPDHGKLGGMARHPGSSSTTH